MDEYSFHEEYDNRINAEGPINQEPLLLQEEKKGFDRELPAELTGILTGVHKDAEYAKNLLVDTFKAKNQEYIKSAQYEQDLKAIRDYKYKTGKAGNITYRQRLEKENRLLNARLTRLSRDKKFGFTGDYGDMREMKKRVNLLQGLLRGGMEPYLGDDGYIDADKFKKILVGAFDSAREACRHYLETHPSPSSYWGKRRRRKASEMAAALEEERNKYLNLQAAVEARAFSKKMEEIKSPQDLIENLAMVRIKSRRFQREGNSQDVYLAEVVDEESRKEGTYYIKENLPLLHKNIDGFLERRTEQLKKSQENKKTFQSGKYPEGEEEEHMEELRMQKAAADERDYKNGLKFLNLLKAKINGAGINERDAERERVAGFFRFDFDKMFLSLQRHNAAVKVYEEEIATHGEIRLDVWKEKAKKDPTAKLIYEVLNDFVKNGGVKEQIKTKTAGEWAIEKMGLNKSKDSDLIRFFKDLDKRQLNFQMSQHLKERNVNNINNINNIQEEKGAQKFVDVLSRTEALLRITMGKEVELYGQMMEGGKLNESEMSQYNTMVTSYLSENYGFSEEVVNTHIRYGEFKRWDGKMTSGAITMQEVARGKEFIDVLKEAEKQGHGVKLTPDCVRQLLRLQMFDTLCQQKDRHGRNFKCVLNKTGKYEALSIRSIKSYDHDQSFAPNDIAGSFKEKKGKDGKLLESQKNRFLPPMLRVIKKNSAMYRYLAREYFRKEITLPNWLDQIKKEEPKIYNGEGKPPVEMTPFVKSNLIGLMYGNVKFEDKEGGLKQVVKGAVDIEGDFFKDEYYEDHSILIRRLDKRKFSKVQEKSIRGNRITGPWERVVDRLKWIIAALQEFYVVEKPDEKKLKNLEKLPEGQQGMHLPELVFRKPDQIDKSKLRSVCKYIRELKELNDEYDFSQFTVPANFFVLNARENKKLMGEMKIDGFNTRETKTFAVKGIFEAWINLTLYNFAQSYGMDPKVREYMIEDDVPEGFEELANENGDLEVPTLLHADEQAYLDLKRMVNDFESPNGTIREELRKQHMTEEAIQATYVRAKQEVERLEYMEGKAKIFLKAMYRDEKDPRRNFFLKKDDYARFDRLEDFAIDPGDSYLAQDNEQYLAVHGMRDFLSKQEQENALEERNKVLTDSKRWNHKADETLTCRVDSYLDKEEREEDEKQFWTKKQLEDYEKEEARKAKELEEEKKRKKAEEERIRREKEEAERKRQEELKKQEEEQRRKDMELQKKDPRKFEIIKAERDLKKWEEEVEKDLLKNPEYKQDLDKVMKELDREKEIMKDILKLSPGFNLLKKGIVGITKEQTHEILKKMDIEEDRSIALDKWEPELMEAEYLWTLVDLKFGNRKMDLPYTVSRMQKACQNSKYKAQLNQKIEYLEKTKHAQRVHIADDRSKELRELKRAIREMDRELKEQKKQKGDGA